MKMEILGLVEEIVYQNTENGYTVLTVSSAGGSLTAVGTMPGVEAGMTLLLRGELTQHPVYGEQLRVSSYEARQPEGEDAALRYLSSGAVKGIGPALARRIVAAFGDDTFRIFEEEPERLAEVKGISMRKAMEISRSMLEKREMRQAMIFLTRYGISPAMAVKIYQRYGEMIYGILQSNPYQLAEDISGIGFKRADEIASKAGIAPDSQFRIRSGILYVLSEASAAGHVCLPPETLVRAAENLLGVDEGEIVREIDNLMVDGRLIVKQDEERVYLPVFYHMELSVARMLLDLCGTLPVRKGGVEAALASLRKETGIELDDLQKRAVDLAAGSGLVLITGGPGTGKTTTIQAVLRYFEQEGLSYQLAAPTGRAARRMKEATGCEASTIHRLLEVSGMPDDDRSRARFNRDENHPLEEDAVIIDEMSMVDLPLMYALLRAIMPGTRLILVGDENQLPSVGPGKVLKDILASEAFPSVRLTRIFRQALESDIVRNAHRIHQGEPVPLDAKSRDFLFIRRPDAESVLGAVLTLVKEKLPDYVHADILDVQVMTPMRKGPLGVENLNRVLQRGINPPRRGRREHEFAQGLFREGDKVMQIRNDYQLEWEVRSADGLLLDLGSGVFNGDIGKILSLNDFAQEILVEFDEGRRVVYSYSQAEELELAYAITVHKSQGSEYPAVVIPLLGGPPMLLTNNLIYTAVTRAKSCVCLVGDPQCFVRMTENREERARYTGLTDRIYEMDKS